MNLDQVRELMTRLQRSRADELTLETDDGRLHLRRLSRSAIPPPEPARTAVTVLDAHAPACGRFLARHPLCSSLPGHALISAGDVIGYLRVGDGLSAILATRPARAVEPLVTDGTLVGWGTPVLRLVL
ncbi:hypothetical protein RBI14_18870 [Alcaligenaceae bacterium B3P038]|nr:hypothetical protein [Alcaligenaceae bacterium B3P038]